jgi:capsid protein
MQQLTKSNMASSRAALMQTWRSFHYESVEMEQSFVHPIVQSIIDEDIARGRLVLPTGKDLAAASKGYYTGPEKLSIDDLREAQADDLRLKIGYSPTTVFRDKGKEFENETIQRSQDQQLKKDLNIEDNIKEDDIKEDEDEEENDEENDEEDNEEGDKQSQI